MAQPFSEQEEAELSRPPVGSNDHHLWGQRREKAQWWFLYPKNTTKPHRDDTVTPSFASTQAGDRDPGYLGHRHLTEAWIPESEREMRHQYVRVPPKLGDPFLRCSVDGLSVMGVRFFTWMESSSQEKLTLLPKEPPAKFSPQSQFCLQKGINSQCLLFNISPPFSTWLLNSLSLLLDPMLCHLLATCGTESRMHSFSCGVTKQSTRGL